MTKRFHNSSYASQMRSGAEPVKTEQRLLIADFIERWHAGSVYRLLTLPGISWRFEGMFTARNPSSEFLGVERDPEIFREAVGQMPIARSYECTRTPITSGRVCIDAVSSDRSTLVNCLLSDLPTIVSTSGSAQMCNRTGVWLDFTSQICSEVLDSLSRIHCLLDPIVPVIPVAVTVLNYRDRYPGRDQEGNSRRAVAILRALETDTYRVRPCATWSYTSDSGTSMRNTTCLLVRRQRQTL